MAKSKARQDALLLLERGLAASLPGHALGKILGKNYIRLGGRRLLLDRYTSVNVVSIGKSADLMAKDVVRRIKITSGIVVIPRGTPSAMQSKKVSVFYSGHPIPNRGSVVAAGKIKLFLEALEPSALVIFLVSGGASSLVSLPDGITLKSKQHVTDLLLKSGASIAEINCVRKHLSKVKGGRLLESLRCHAISLVMSDVIGDDLSVIASGITYCDKSTFSDAKKILIRYGLEKLIPKSAWKRILLGDKGKIPETPKKPRIENHVILNNKDSVLAMVREAKKLGYSARMVWPVDGKVKAAASKILKFLPLSDHSCIVFGGETTVTVTGAGIGGRNEELVLNMLKKIRAGENVVVASMGTDGKDGSSPAAGAIATSSTYSEDLDEYLKENNSFCYLKKHGGAIFTGPTHTNLLDIGLILRK